ncbi:HyaD/HybD family hydrogenase maturation endopeptidase [Selenomonas caprae]|uniref:HyaD/HybD family hydrogenase maturation endopeptidase n=1 Tax=Selenomonas caprae TaxID=2606905 RepID=A0A5D6WFL3_9FIRM|nr:HyaD/HybD family hydrogenase maturation endopeptidase [Selenomonas caprae]TYZ26873.1 HyaD/HybD family hydrogenase maturation endopeptidase [Selenomonas caprae]
MADVFGNGSDAVSSLDNVLHPADVTILGVGNVILRDEGFGVRVAEYLDAHYEFPENVQIVDGGTLGIELTQYVTGTNKLLVIDSINGGAEPGTLFRFHNDDVMDHFQEKISAHEVGIQDVLALLTVTGHKIPDVVVIGAQPYDLEAGVELSPGMQKLMPQVVEQALKELAAWGIKPQVKENAAALDFGIVAEEAIRRDS